MSANRPRARHEPSAFPESSAEWVAFWIAQVIVYGAIFVTAYGLRRLFAFGG